MATYVDSHIHLSDPAYSPDLDHMMAQMERLDIAACAVSMDYENSVQTLKLADTCPGRVLPFVGIHPEKVAGRGDDILDDELHRLELLAEQNAESVVGVGEVGLDPTYCGGDDAIWGAQLRAFERMLELAARIKKPVSIHSRKGLERVLEVMTSFESVRASLHWFDGGKRQLARAQDMGLYVSYGPVCVFAGDKQRLMKLTDGDRMLVETDGPVRFARCFGGVAAQPLFVASVINTAAAARGVPFGDVASEVAKNSARYLGKEM